MSGAEPVLLRPGNSSACIFLFPALGFHALVYRPLADLLPSGVTVYGFDQLTEGSVSERAAAYVAKIRQVQPDGPYVLAGWSFGGFLAWEVASQLQRDGAQVELVVAIDSVCLDEDSDRLPMVSVARDFGWLLSLAGADGERRAALPYRRLIGMSPADQLDAVVRALAEQGFWSPEAAARLDGGLRDFFIGTSGLRGHRPGPYQGRFLLFRAADQRLAAADTRFRLSEPALGWKRYADPAPMVVPIPGDHFSVLTEPSLSVIADQLTTQIGALT
ncbi:thioesterase domain-containing protein [Streptomyces flaveolus]|uniref:thioesterase domain-containing protein n=1 Tax=Streptomyces flaveolus TaxID=67297 RepID=UPI003700005F